MTQSDVTVNMNVPGLPAKATASTADLVPIWDAEAAAHRHVPVAGLPGSRSIVTPKGDDAAISMELPAAVDRRDFLLGFTATGAVTTTKVATAKDVDDIAARGMTTVDTIADLGAARRRAGGAVHVRGYHKPGDGGGGTYMWNATSTAAPNKGTVFAVDGGVAGRWIKLYDQLVNIKAFGAKGDGTTDDTAAVQAAVSSGSPLFVPVGQYKLTSSITWDHQKLLIMIGQSRDSVFVDHRINTDEPTFHRYDLYMKADGTYNFSVPFQNKIGKQVILKNLTFLANHQNAYGHCFECFISRSFHAQNCVFASSYRGLTLEMCFDNMVIGCDFRGTFYKKHDWDDYATAAKAWGLYTSNHTYIYGSATNKCGTGLYLTGVGNVASGARLEENFYGIILGGPRYSGENGGGIIGGRLTRSRIEGISLEANKIGMRIDDITSTTVSGCGAQGSPGIPNERPDSELGFLINSNAADCVIESLSASGTFTRGCYINYGKPLANSYGNSPNMIIGGQNSALSSVYPPTPSYRFISSLMFPDAVNSRHKTMTAFHDLMLPGLTGINIRDKATSGIARGGPVFTKQLGDVVSPASGATSVSVKFFGGACPGHAAFNKITVANDENSKLSPGTYYYAMTFVARHAETGIQYGSPSENNTTHKVIEVAAQQKVNITIFGFGGNVIRRIYRGRKSGWFEGYWDLPVNNSFSDNGTIAFSGKGMPPAQGYDIPSLHEDDANYQIVATPSWATTVHVTNKATSGFTLNFGTPAPDAYQSVSWLLFRP